MRPILIAVWAVIALAGCSSSDPGPQQPTPAANVAACQQFAEATNTWLPSIERGSDAWDAELEQIDMIGLSADGYVRERIFRLIDEVPDVSVVYVDEAARQEVNKLVGAVARACSAEGISVEVNTYAN